VRGVERPADAGEAQGLYETTEDLQLLGLKVEGGVDLSEQETYGRYQIVGGVVPSSRDGIEYRLKARIQEFPRESPRVLQVVISRSALMTRFDGKSDVEVAREQGVIRMHGLLDFGLFDGTSEYRWTLTSEEERLEPPVKLETPGFGDNPERQAFYHILKALRRARRESPRDYTSKKLDPAGACLILGVDRNDFDYYVGRLRERGWIAKYQLVDEGGRTVYHGNLFGGGFYIVEDGVRALEEMEHSLVRPTWMTAKAPEEVKQGVPAVVRVIEEWIPKQRYGSEEPYQSALAEHLVGQGISAPEQQGASLTDILAAHGIGVEIKLTPGRSDYDRLVGQIVRQLEEFGVVIALIVRSDRRDLLEEYESRFVGDDRVIFITTG
jgi:hypothetical protein